MLLALAFQFVMQHQDAIRAGADQIAAPGAVDERSLAGSIPDVSRAVLTCYHKSARMTAVEIAPAAYNDAPQYGADGSAVLRIYYTGFSQARYAMTVALMARGTPEQAEMRVVVLDDTALVPYARGCPLQDWTPVTS
ncbi:hypothetical protein [Paraburkholderia hospita]|uniref:hypothetical protein n=1 Tax=Paraburkholderia hospita TaxID=169430 RepID=UPI0009A56B86|nr:hypothetical protein [Paraburkholderia hospita]SKC92289.1 hypothetical protein SAMN05446934_6043 [Paraburkholderia hospita]